MYIYYIYLYDLRAEVTWKIRDCDDENDYYSFQTYINSRIAEINRRRGFHPTS